MGVSGEGLWAVEIGNDLYEIRNAPWHARNINWGDIVRAIPTGDGEHPQFVSVVKRSGHRTIHMFVLEEGQPRKEELLAELKHFGASYEHANGRTYALDFQPESRIQNAVKYLEEMRRSSLVDFRVSACD
jgi:hypothetical protein